MRARIAGLLIPESVTIVVAQVGSVVRRSHLSECQRYVLDRRSNMSGLVATHTADPRHASGLRSGVARAYEAHPCAQRLKRQEGAGIGRGRSHVGLVRRSIVA